MRISRCAQLVDDAQASWLRHEDGTVDDITVIIVRFN